MSEPQSCPVQQVTRGPRAVAIGAFDGVHLGHGVVVRSVLDAADRLGARSAALTFEPTPRQHFGRDHNARYRLTPDPERVGLLCNLGIEQVIVQSFDEELRATSPEDFVRSILLERLEAKYVAIGQSHSFGAGRDAGPEAMVEYGRKYGFEVYIVPLVSAGELDVSSTKIRAALRDGDVATASKMLGRPYTVSGIVERGNRIGTDLGWPTANVSYPRMKFVPGNGVYAGVARVGEPDSPLVAAAISLGPAPSVGVEQRRLEAHLIGFEGDIYDEEITVGFIERLRGIETFDSLEELNTRVRADIDETQRIYESLRAGS